MNDAIVRNVARAFERRAQYREVNARLGLHERFEAIRHNYRLHEQDVKEGWASWMCLDPYQLADWISLFTPIEAAVWGDIRYYGVPMWPQLPVGRFFADFGNPIAKVALECDGAAYHDSVKDAARDREFAKMGWRVIRAPGSRCVKVMDSAADLRAKGECVPFGYEQDIDDMTMDGIMKELRSIFRKLEAN